MIEAAVMALSLLLGYAVSSGVHRERFRKSQSDLNGLGRKYGKMVSVLVRWADTDEKREQVADLIDPSK